MPLFSYNVPSDIMSMFHLYDNAYNELGWNLIGKQLVHDKEDNNKHLGFASLSIDASLITI